MRRRFEWGMVAAGFVVTASYLLVVRALGGSKIPTSFDTYRHFFPNALYMIDALRDGGLLWNPYLSCGSPFFATGSNGVLYPGNVFFFLFSPDQALTALLLFNLAVAGVSTYALCREIGLGVIPSWCGALAFQLGNASLDQTTWTPMLSGSYAWLPAAVLFCERTLRAPSWGNAVGLATSLALALLPGFPQNLLFTYQVLGLRLVWAFMCDPRGALRPAGFVVAGMVLPLLMTAVQLLPSIEVARNGMRGSQLSSSDVLGAGALDWAKLRHTVSLKWALHNPFVLLPTLFVANGLFRSTTRRATLFYLSVSVLYFVLAFGPGTPLFGLYTSLPLTGLFRDPARFVWVLSFTLAVCVALGIEALSAPATRQGRWLPRGGVVLAPAAILLAYSYLPRQGLERRAWYLAIATLVATACASQSRWRRPALLLIALLLSFNLCAFPINSPSGTVYASWAMRGLPPRGILPNAYQTLTQHADFFAQLRARTTPQERAYLVYGHPSYALNAKTPSLFRVASVFDYEPQPTKRFAQYFVMLLKGQLLRTINEYYIPLRGLMPPSLRRRLLDLTAARYVVADVSADTTAGVMYPPLRLLLEQDQLRLYENPQALPRAFYVPHVQVVRDSASLLRLLANGAADLRQLAYVEEDSPSGFTGLVGTDGQGTVDFEMNEPTRIVLRVNATERGFVFLSDQYYPGWRATVNESVVPIQRANYAFRLVEVPAGAARVELRYRPASVRIGAAVSACTLLGLLLLGVQTVRRRNP